MNDYQANLRNKAEKILATEHPNLNAYSSAEFAALVHELQVHQIELGLQNEELQKTQVELEASRNHYADLFDHAPVGYLILNGNKRIIQVNMTGTKLLGMLRGNLLNKLFFQLVAEVDQGKFLLLFNRLIQTQLPQSFEVQLLKADHTLFDAQLECMALPQGEANRYRIAFIDITTHKQVEKQAFELAIEKENVRILTDFMSDVGHDIRTPLTILMTGIHLLAMESLSEKAQQRIKNLQEQMERLAQLVESMFQMSSLDMTDKYQFEKINIRELIQRLIKDSNLLVEAKHQTLLFSCDTNPLIMINPVLIRRAVGNIIRNASAYSLEASTIQISVFSQQQSVVIEIKDEGMGISSSDLPHIFERFYRADKSRNLTTGGSGLGLTIAQKIIQAHQGQIEVESEVGKGSIFRITLPLPPELIP